MDQEQELQAIERLIGELYASICFERGEKPPLGILERVFMPGGTMINNDGATPQTWTVPEYIARFNKLIAEGRFDSFHEVEVAQRTELFGKIAHRFSTYETRFDPADPEPYSKGINSIQLLKVGRSWFISCMVWNNQTADRPLPERYL